MAKRTRDSWETEETRFFLNLVNERKVMRHLDGKKFRVEEIFAHLEGAMHQQGYVKTSKQMQTRFRTLRAKYNKIKKSLGASGSGNTAFDWPFYIEMDELLGDRPIVQQVGVDSIAGRIEGFPEEAINEVLELDEPSNYSRNQDTEAETQQDYSATDEIQEESENQAIDPVSERTKQPRSRNAKRTLVQNLERFAEISKKKNLDNQTVLLDRQSEMITNMIHQQHEFERQQLQLSLEGQRTMMKEMTSTFLLGVPNILHTSPMPAYNYQHSYMQSPRNSKISQFMVPSSSSATSTPSTSTFFPSASPSATFIPVNSQFMSTNSIQKNLAPSNSTFIPSTSQFSPFESPITSVAASTSTLKPINESNSTTCARPSI